VIVMSAAGAVIAILLLVVGAIASNLPVLYIAIGVAAASALLLAVGFFRLLRARPAGSGAVAGVVAKAGSRAQAGAAVDAPQVSVPFGGRLAAISGSTTCLPDSGLPGSGPGTQAPRLAGKAPSATAFTRPELADVTTAWPAAEPVSADGIANANEVGHFDGMAEAHGTGHPDGTAEADKVQRQGQPGAAGSPHDQRPDADAELRAGRDSAGHAAGEPAPDVNAGPAELVTADERDPAAQVWIVRGVSRHHLRDCVFVQVVDDDDVDTMTLAESESIGCIPCRACHTDD